MHSKMLAIQMGKLLALSIDIRAAIALHKDLPVATDVLCTTMQKPATRS